MRTSPNQDLQQLVREVFSQNSLLWIITRKHCKHLAKYNNRVTHHNHQNATTFTPRRPPQYWDWAWRAQTKQTRYHQSYTSLQNVSSQERCNKSGWSPSAEPTDRHPHSYTSQAAWRARSIIRSNSRRNKGKKKEEEKTKITVIKGTWKKRSELYVTVKIQYGMVNQATTHLHTMDEHASALGHEIEMKKSKWPLQSYQYHQMNKRKISWTEKRKMKYKIIF